MTWTWSYLSLLQPRSEAKLVLGEAETPPLPVDPTRRAGALHQVLMGACKVLPAASHNAGPAYCVEYAVQVA